MEIIVGKGPDFKMTRGNEILIHAVSVETWKAGQVVHRHVLSHFSLVMLCKNVQEIMVSTPYKNAGIDVVTKGNSIQVSFIFTDTSIGLVARYKHPPDLMPVQIYGITVFIRELFVL